MRLFVALEFPLQTRARLAALVESLPGARWVPPASYHLTLRFIGETPPDRAEEIDHALFSLRGRGFDLTLSGIGLFERGGRVSTIWAGAKRSEALLLLQAKIETALQRAGCAPERRRFTPHVTLARIEASSTSRLAAFLQHHALFREGPLPIAHFTLFGSHPGKDEPQYVAEAHYELAEAAAAAP